MCDDPFTRGSEGSLGLLAFSGLEQSATETVVIFWNRDWRAPVWIGGTKALWRSETCNPEGSTFSRETRCDGEVDVVAVSVYQRFVGLCCAGDTDRQEENPKSSLISHLSTPCRRLPFFVLNI